MVKDRVRAKVRAMVRAISRVRARAMVRTREGAPSRVARSPSGTAWPCVLPSPAAWMAKGSGEGKQG